MRRHRRHSATDRTEAERSGESAVPKILGILMAFMLLRLIIKVGHRVSGSPAIRARRHATIAELHRRLHSEEAAGSK